MPLFSIAFPANAKFLYSMIISITQFDILPSGIFESALFSFGDDDEAVNEDFDELDIFKYFSVDFLSLFVNSNTLL